MPDEAAPSSDAATGDAPLLLRSDDGAIARLTLNRPRQYNALSAALMAELQAALDDIAETSALRAVIIEGAGRGFCAGHDLKELRGRSGDRAFFQGIFQQCSRLMTSIISLPQPVIAKVQGIATAAGCQLVATCDLAVAAADQPASPRRASISGSSARRPWSRCRATSARKQAMEMLLTGRDAPGSRRALSASA